MPQPLESLPKQRAVADVVIVGGGIVGAATAYYLANAGVKCTLLERDSIASHASGFAYGGIGGLGEGTVHSPTFPIATEGFRLHRQLAREIKLESGVDPEYRDRPVLALAFDRAEADAMQAHLRWQKEQQGYSVSWLGAYELRALEPRISERAHGAVRIDGTADVDPYRLVLALAQAAEARGATVRSAEVVGLDIYKGKAVAVRTRLGSIPCGAVVVASGPWAAECGRWLGFRLPVRPLKGQILRLRMPGPPVGFSIGWGKHYATTKPDGLLWAGSTEEDAGFDETATAAGRDSIMSALMRMAPSTADALLVRQTACLRPVTPDGLIALGPAPGVEGVFIGTGGGRQGIVLGPAMGMALAELVVSGTSALPIAPFDPGRFVSA
ncbi:MAG: FAD-dependent oxidoreductase [SAR202 cluster bacterium]|nr:FAD-dependent oxidoreductase [SAR202 cluster bacterium]